MTPRSGDFEGILLVDKPKGITSHDVVDRLRRKLKMKRIGHAGTLDPMATGLLVMLIGKATKASQYLIKEASVSTVPWDDAGAYIRFSATFESAGDEDDERVIAELSERLGKANLSFD